MIESCDYGIKQCRPVRVDCLHWQCPRCSRLFDYDGPNPPKGNCISKQADIDRVRTNLSRYGPGTMLHAFLRRWFGAKTSTLCACGLRIVIMDIWEPKICRKNVHIIVGWIVEAAMKTRWRILFSCPIRPVLAWGLKCVVLNICRQSEKRHAINSPVQ